MTPGGHFWVGHAGVSKAGPDGESSTECEHCGRVFRAAALVQHQRLCTAEKPMKRVVKAQQGLAAAEPPPNSSSESPSAASAASTATICAEGIGAGTGACGKCGETFATAALASHEAVCGTATASADTKTCNTATADAVSTLGSKPLRLGPESPGAAGAGEERVKCAECGRCFAAAALARHEAVCRKVFQQKRKPLNTSAQRLAGM
jgi:hypothetical protein